jgi:cell division protein FtsW (lipid II flippase)
MSYFHNYIYLIIVLKLLFVVLSISNIYLKSKDNTDAELSERVVYWKERVEFIFVILMAILLIYLFNPRHDHKDIIDKHVKILLYLFGFILLITAKWSTFFKESIWFIDIQKMIGGER